MPEGARALLRGFEDATQSEVKVCSIDVPDTASFEQFL
jgi:hypothetical protein